MKRSCDMEFNAPYKFNKMGQNLGEWTHSEITAGCYESVPGEWIDFEVLPDAQEPYVPAQNEEAHAVHAPAGCSSSSGSNSINGNNNGMHSRSSSGISGSNGINNISNGINNTPEDENMEPVEAIVETPEAEAGRWTKRYTLLADGTYSWAWKFWKNR